MFVLPWERLVGRGAPERDKFAFIFDKGRDGFSVALFVETADWFRVKG
jgi:hypothetical protein